MSRDINPFGLRMPPELRAQLEAAARASGRSLNTEIVERLDASFPKTLEWLKHNRAEEIHALKLSVDEQVRYVAARKQEGTVQKADLLELGRRRVLLNQIESDAHMLDMVSDLRADELLTLAEAGATPPISFEARKSVKKKAR